MIASLWADEDDDCDDGDTIERRLVREGLGCSWVVGNLSVMYEAQCLLSKTPSPEELKLKQNKTFAYLVSRGW